MTGGEWASGTIQWSNKPAADVLLHGNIGHNNVTGYTVNCLTAVQHWYDGDSTGQNENYGIMLRYYDETTADYNAVYSADYTDETKRPKLTIYYAPAEGIIPDGVYYIRSAYVGLYLGTSGSIAENTPVKLYSQASSGLAQLRQLWKVTYLGNYYYSIRPMHKLNMGLHVTSNSVDIVSIGTTDTLDSVVLANRWGIEPETDGYYINYVNTGSISMRPATGAIGLGMNVVTGQNSGLTDFKWELEEVDNPPSGTILYNLETKLSYTSTPTFQMYIGETKTLADFGVQAAFYSGHTNRQDFDWMEDSTLYVTVNSEIGAVTGTALGTAEISGVIDLSEDGFGTYSVRFAVSVERKYLGELQYWYDDEQTQIIGKWDSASSIYFENLDSGNTAFHFNTATNSAISQWNTALGFSMSYATNSLAADIYYYGGTMEQLNDLGFDISYSTLGQTIIAPEDRDYLGEYYTFGEKEIMLFHINYARVALVSFGGDTNISLEVLNTKTAAHELGHALGFFGHITDSVAIMTQGPINLYQLTDKDINHLAQLYD